MSYVLCVMQESVLRPLHSYDRT